MSSKIIPGLVGSTFITLMIGTKSTTINDSHPNYNAIREAVKTKNYDVIESLIDIAKSIAVYSQGKISIRDGAIYYGTEEVKNSIVSRILQMLNEGFDIDPMVAFLENLMQNPSKRAVDELYGFLEAAKLPITEDGHFLAYKKVNSNFKDFYTGKMDNSVGAVLEMPRNRVDEDKDRTCSYGLHFCAFEYLSHYHGGSGKVVILKIHPRDVVSIPSDYNNAKGRACRYEVIGEHEGHDTTATFQDVSVYTPGGQAAAPARSTAKKPSIAYDRGYSQGVSDRARDDGYYNSKVSRTSSGCFASKEYAAEYAAGYDAGYAAQTKTLNLASQDLGEAYTRGFENGYKVFGLENSIYNSSIQKTKSGEWASADYQDQYNVGYADGWSKAEDDKIAEDEYENSPEEFSADYALDQDPYDQGFEDASNGNPYDASAGGPDNTEYRADYARGWADAKNQGY